MEILLMILKITGIVLLILLLLFLTLILSVVFIPVRYRIKGRAASPDEIEGDMMISFMLHLIHGRIQISGQDIRYKIRILGIPLSLNKEKKPRRKRKRPSSKTKAKESASTENTAKEERAKDSIQESQPEISAEGEALTEQAEKQNSEKQEIVAKQPEPRKKKKSRHRIKQLWKECRAWILRLEQTIAGLKDKSITWKEQLGNIKNIILEETNKNAVILLFREFNYLMKHFSPKKVSGTLQYGMEDPALTGQILGAASVFPFWARYQIAVQPDFTAESFFVKGDIWMKGHIRALHLLRTGIRLIKDKNIRKLINQIKK